jgi:general L-amino acid transport system permease protein
VISLLGLHDFLGTANSIVSGQRAWVGYHSEMFMFVALVYWLFTFSMSKVSAHMEKTMGVGER